MLYFFHFEKVISKYSTKMKGCFSKYKKEEGVF